MFDPLLFKDQVILVTGATGGVGSATAHQAGPLAGLAEELGVHAIAADVSKVDDCERIIDEVLRRHGRLDALVNCAGVWVQGESETATEADWSACLDTNLKGSFFSARARFPPSRRVAAPSST